MTTDYAVHATWTAPLTPAAEDQLLEMVPGTVVSHPPAAPGTTVVAIPFAAVDVHHAARILPGWTATLELLAGAPPVSLSVDPIDPD